MVCKVCKKELSSPVCSFCGEDNGPLVEEVKTPDTIIPSDDTQSNGPIHGVRREKRNAKPAIKRKLNKKSLQSLLLF